MNRNLTKLTLACIAAIIIPCQTTMAQDDDTIYLSDKDVTGIYKTKTKEYVSVHDPSVVYDANSKNFYIYGTHQGTARTSNLQSWQGLSNDFFGIVNSNGNVVKAAPDQAFVTNRTKKVNAIVNGTVKEVDFGPFDAQAWSCAWGNWSVYGNMWAPDIIYNPTMKKWCMYLSLNGPNWNCVIILLTSNSITGPFVYQGPVVYSGFFNANEAVIKWTKTDLPLVLGYSNSLPARYNLDRGWGGYWPNCIDPCVFYDDKDQLWMTYGSWSGGIFMFKLDKTTGLRDYTQTYQVTTDNDGRPLYDPYFGKRIAGGYYVSGEASYIQKIGNYYFLFVTNGGLEAKGGYVMRVFRSKNPDGPFTDIKGTSSIYPWYQMNYGTGDAEMRGNLLVASHNNLGFQTEGQVAQGHNSAIVDNDGRAFVVYHTRFDSGHEGHQVRVRQLFTNKEGWIVAAPFEFNGETLNDDSIKAYAKFTDKQIAGSYQVHLLRYKLNNDELECVTPKNIVLNETGTITGELTGKWSTTPNTGFISITLSGNTYSGVVLEQMFDGTTIKSISFTGLSKQGTEIWGVKMQPKYAIAYNLAAIKTNVTNNMTVNRNIDLSATTTYGVKYEWISSHPDILSNTGKYNPTDEDVAITLTNRISCDNYVYEKEYQVTAKADDNLPGDYTTGIVAYYDFDQIPMYNHYDTEQTAMLTKLNKGTAPVLVEDPLMVGKVGYVKEATDQNLDAGYFRMKNPLSKRQDLEGATISLWVKRMDDNWFGTLWSFTEKMPNIRMNNPHLFITSNNYVGYTNLTDTFSINYPKAAKNDITKGKWVLLTVTISREDGVNIYVNKLKRGRTFNSTMGEKNDDFDYAKVIETIQNSSFFTIGLGNAIATAEAYYDDLIIYDRALTAEDIALLYSKETRLTDFKPQTTEIQLVENDNNLKTDGIYDLSGRKVDAIPTSHLRPGIYVISQNGKTKKIIVK